MVACGTGTRRFSCKSDTCGSAPPDACILLTTLVERVRARRAMGGENGRDSRAPLSQRAITLFVIINSVWSMYHSLHAVYTRPSCDISAHGLTLTPCAGHWGSSHCMGDGEDT